MTQLTMGLNSSAPGTCGQTATCGLEQGQGQRHHLPTALSQWQSPDPNQSLALGSAMGVYHPPDSQNAVTIVKMIEVNIACL